MKYRRGSKKWMQRNVKRTLDELLKSLQRSPDKILYITKQMCDDAKPKSSGKKFHTIWIEEEIDG